MSGSQSPRKPYTRRAESAALRRRDRLCPSRVAGHADVSEVAGRPNNALTLTKALTPPSAARAHARTGRFAA
jgi:hypothetical protein